MTFADRVAGEAIFLDAVLGFAKNAAGTRLVAGNGAGEPRLYALTLAGVEGFHAPPGPVVVALLDRGGDAVLIAGAPGNKPQAYTLRPVGAHQSSTHAHSQHTSTDSDTGRYLPRT